ncbi:hypothetical protein Tco_0103996 [Tanacetum coccineum]
MARSSTNELFTPYKQPEQEFRSSRRHFKTLSLDELRSPDFNLLSDQEYSEEVAETMAETMEQYMSKTRANYGSGVVRPKIKHKDNFELKGQLLKELPIQAQLNNLGREIKKVNEKVYVAQVGCEQCKGPYYTKDWPLKEEGKTLEEAYYTQFGGPFQGGGYRATAPDAAIRNKGASIKTLEIQIGQMSKVLQERGFGSLPSSTETSPRDQVKSISTTIEADVSLIRRIRSSQYDVSTGQNNTLLYKSRQMTIPFLSRLNNHYCKEGDGNYGPKFAEAYGASHIKDTIPRKEKDPGSLTLPCFINNVYFDNALVDLGASVSVMPLLTYLNLGLGELAHTKLTVELADGTVKYPKGIAENVLVGIGKFTFPVDFIILDMPEDIKVPLILGRPFLSLHRLA